MQEDYAPPNFASKVPCESFRLAPLNHAIGRLISFLNSSQLLRMNDPEIGWSDDTWTEQYWPEVRKELELIWKRLPEDSREIFPRGWEGYFEGLEELLLEIRLDYFETPPQTPLCPLNEHVIDQLKCFADVLKNCPEPDSSLAVPIQKDNDSICSVEIDSGGKTTEAPATGSSAPTAPAEGKKPAKPKRKPRKNKNEPTDNQRLLIAALTKHHGYRDGGCDCFTPVGSNALARLANIPKRNSSIFFKKQFGGYHNYRKLCGDAGKLIGSLKMLNGEFRPTVFKFTRTLDEVKDQTVQEEKSCERDDE